MSILDRFRTGGRFDAGTLEGALLRDFLQAIGRGNRLTYYTIDAMPESQPILQQDRRARGRIVVLMSRLLRDESLYLSGGRGWVLKALMRHMMGMRLPFDEDQLATLVQDLCTRKTSEWDLPVTELAAALERRARKHGMSEGLRRTFRSLLAFSRSSDIPVADRRRLELLLRAEEEVLPPDPWGRRVAADLAAMPESAQQGWRALLDHAATTAGKTRPTRKWLRQAGSQVAALGEDERGWKYQLQGAFDSFNTPARPLPGWGLTVEFWVEAVTEPATETGIFQYLTTDQVRFLKEDQPVELAEVPELAFTEAMRDVDLFTSVCSVGNDPRWQDQGENPGWNDYWTSVVLSKAFLLAADRKIKDPTIRSQIDHASA